MISHFWNLCKACPAVDVDKLHSEYRSTYKWHEVVSTAASKAQLQQEVIKRPPKPTSDDFHFTRKKKHPEVAYKSHEFFDPSLAPKFPTRATQEAAVDFLASSARERSTQRRTRQLEHSTAQRRAQSEGPGIRNPLFRVTTDIRPTVPTTAGPASNNNNNNASSKSSSRRKYTKSSQDLQDGSMQSSYPPPAPSSKWNNRQTNGSSARQKQMKESVSMGQIDGTKGKSESNVEEAASKSVCGPDATDSRSRRYRSEYRQRFRPFSQYEYVDGHFVPSPGTQSPPTAIKTHQQQHQKLQQQQKAVSLHGEPWYQEVVELRRQANDYKCRGWGTDLVPPHMSDIYHKQMDLHEAAARRGSLSALSLAISSPRPTETSAVSKADHRISPSKSASLGRPSRPRTAPPTRGSAKSSRSESAHPVSDTAAIDRHLAAANVSKSRDLVDSSATARKTSAAGSRAKSPTKRMVGSRPPSASTASSSVAPSPAPVHTEVNGGWKGATSAVQQPVATKRQRPNETPPGGSVKSTASSGMPECIRRPYSRASSKATSNSRPPSAFENNIDYFREPVVKSPPEPTRVKSPEAVARSPDPINWTVPLDTGKTFSVTQSVRDGESLRHSPMSDHSSLFDSVSGTAINLGRAGIGGVPVPLHGSNQRISSLAKEVARDLQPGLIKDSTMTKPAPHSSEFTDGKPVATEAHPNPSIPELAEENAKDEVDLPNSNNNGQELDLVPDVMTTSIYQPSGASNGQEEHVNGASAVVVDSDAAVAKEVAGTTLKCLEDPSFMFDASKEPQQAKKPSYRVLEDPFETAPPPAVAAPPPASNMSKPKAPAYRVLEDPMTTGMYDPTTSSDAAAATTSSSRPMSTEVLEGARERFDKFWSKNKESTSES